jgi:uncharacterized protein YdhG (YjbR/CyaY superfamily)
MMYTPEERRTILYVLSEVMLADGIVHPKEKEFFDKIYNSIGAKHYGFYPQWKHIDSQYAKEIFETNG